MKKNRSLILAVLLLVVSFIIFVYLDNGWNFANYVNLINPLLFTFSLTSMLWFNKSRRIFLRGSIMLFGLMIFFYLLNNINLANLFGSLGFGILVITIICYSPELIEKGYIEKL